MDQRRPFVNRIQSASRQVGSLAAWRSPLLRALRPRLFGLLQGSPALARRSALLSAGYNPREAPFLDSRVVSGE